MNFRIATKADLALVKHWDEQPHVKESDNDTDWEWDKELGEYHEWREQLIAEEDGEAIGFVQIIDPALEETHYWGNVPHNLKAIDIWIGQAENLNKGYGTIMMKMAIKRCFSNPDVTAIIIEPLKTNTKAIRFYQRMGFMFKEDRMFEGDLCSVHQLNRPEWIKTQSI